MIQLQNVTKKYGRKVILDDVSITFQKGRVTCLLGFNGVGKSTTMKAIMRLIPINNGSITLDGERISERNIHKLSYIPDITTHDSSLTVEQNLQFAEVLYDQFDREKANKMMAFFNLPLDRRLKDLSKGNLARFNLTIGMCQNVPYLLMDEPFTGIDLFMREQFIDALKTQFLDPNQTLILTTHEIDEVQNLVDDIILLSDGRVQVCFTKEEALQEGLTVVEKMRHIYHQGGNNNALTYVN